MEGFRTLCSDGNDANNGVASSAGDELKEVATYDAKDFKPYSGDCDPVSPAKEMEFLQRQSRIFKPVKGENDIDGKHVFICWVLN